MNSGAIDGHLLVIAYGNTLRCDDGAGVALAERLVEHWRASAVPVSYVVATQLTPDLATALAEHETAAVVFVDAAVAKDCTVLQVRPIEVDRLTPTLGHHLDPAALMVYARLLTQRPPPAWLVTVPGVDFGYGEELSPSVQALLTTAPAIADALLQKVTHLADGGKVYA